MYYGTAPIVTNGLVGYYDTSNALSYNSGSVIWKDLTGNCDLLVTGSGASPIYWIGSQESIPSIATTSPNIVLYSNDFTNSAWNKTRTGYTSTITASVISPPPGLPNSGSKLNETIVNSYHGVVTSFNSSIGTPFRIAFYAKAAERSWIRYENVDWSSFFINFDLINGVTGSKNLGPAIVNGVRYGLYDPKIESAGDGWWRCSFYIIPGYDSVTIGLSTMLNDSTPSYVGTPTSGVYLYGVSTAYGTENTAYVDTSTTSSMNLYSAYLEYTGSAIQENNEHSVFTWVKGFSSPSGRNVIYSKYSGSAGIAHYITPGVTFILTNSNTVQINDLSSFFPGTRPITAHGWSQIGVTRNATQVKYYWNGINIATLSRNTATTSSATVKFGNNVGEGPTVNYNGHAGLGFGNILIYNRAISEQEASQNFNAMKTKYRLLTPQTQFGLRTTTGN